MSVPKDISGTDRVSLRGGMAWPPPHLRRGGRASWTTRARAFWESPESSDFDRMVGVVHVDDVSAAESTSRESDSLRSRRFCTPTCPVGYDAFVTVAIGVVRLLTKNEKVFPDATTR